MKFVDLHCHPTYKTIFNDLYGPWDNIQANDALLGNIIESQGNLYQWIQNKECNLLCISLYAPETAFVGNFLIRLAPLFTDALDKDVLNNMIDKTFDYSKEIKSEVDNLALPPINPIKTKPLLILKNWSEYDPADFNSLYVVFSIEGGHSFYGKNNDDSDIDDVIDNFTLFINSKDRLVIYITPCHLTPNIFMTHAYGLKLLGKGKFLPEKKGISPDGEKFLDAIAQTNLFIDVKHMSLISRQQLYQNAAWNKKPLLCSHAGVTGISWNRRLDKDLVSIKTHEKFIKVRYHKKPRGLLKGTTFNPISLNLYDEDIVKIIESKGLIGISMDLRILGGDVGIFQKPKLHEKEFISPEEFEIWKQLQSNAIISEIEYELPYPDFNLISGDLPDEIWDEEDWADQFEELNLLRKKDIENFYLQSGSNFTISSSDVIFIDRQREHLLFFVNQVFHIVQVAINNKLSIDPWKQICIGTDFDGFIRALDCCKNAGYFEEFAEALEKMLPILADEAKLILPPYSVYEVVEDIMFNNLYRLLQQYKKTPHFAE